MDKLSGSHITPSSYLSSQSKSVEKKQKDLNFTAQMQIDIGKLTQSKGSEALTSYFKAFQAVQQENKGFQGIKETGWDKLSDSQKEAKTNEFLAKSDEKHVKEFHDTCAKLETIKPGLMTPTNKLTLAEVTSNLKTEAFSLNHAMKIGNGKWMSEVLANSCLAIEDKAYEIKTYCKEPSVRNPIKHENLTYNPSPKGDILGELNEGALVEPPAVGLQSDDTQWLNNYKLSVAGQDGKPADLELKGYQNTGVKAEYKLENSAEQVSVARKQVVNKGLFDQLDVTNNSSNDKTVKLDITSHVMDIFEVRNGHPKVKRPFEQDTSQPGKIILNTVMDDKKKLGVQVAVKVDGKPADVNAQDIKLQVGKDNTLTAEVKIPGKSTKQIEVSVQPIISDSSQNIANQPFVNGKAMPVTAVPTDIKTAEAGLSTDYKNLVTAEMAKFAAIGSGVFAGDASKVMNKAVQDMQTLTNVLHVDGKDHKYPVAGVPLYGCLFGRDSLTSSKLVVPTHPELVKGTLEVLFALQGKSLDDRIAEEKKLNPNVDTDKIKKLYKNRNEAKGKILHEMRVGDLAQKRMIDHCPHYGTVDATPLALMVLSDYHKWSGDKATIQKLLPNAEAALEWINKNQDQDGFLKFIDPSGQLTNQGWKDSGHSAKHELGPDGKVKLPKYPIALAEVQGYVYAAKMGMAEVYKDLGQPEKAQKLEQEAAKLKESFNKKFWLDKEQFIAMALDADGKPIHSITSNGSQCLSTGILEKDKSEIVEKTTMGDDLNSGWGIRTLGKSSHAYNYMSYHNGSVWPHEMGLIAPGLKRENAAKIAKQFMEATATFPDKSVREVFSGDARKPEDKEIDIYSDACCPQAWSSAAMVSMPFTFLGIKPDLKNNQLVLDNPVLPDGMDYIKLENVRVKNFPISLEVSRLKNNELGITAKNARGETMQVLKEVGNNKYMVDVKNLAAPAMAN